MVKVQFGEILHQARVDKGMSLRKLSAQSGIEFSRLSRMEHGTRPAPALPHLRRLSELLSLNLVDLLVSAGTPREAVEQLLWVERLQQAKRVEDLADYSPEGHRAGMKNEFVVRVLSRDDSFCRAELGSETWCMLAFSDAETLRLIVPPEAIHVFSKNPQDITLMPCNVFRSHIQKMRKIGRLLNLVLDVGGIELNALVLSDPNQRKQMQVNEDVFISISPVALLTEPVGRAKGRK